MIVVQMTLCPNGRIAGIDPGLVRIVTLRWVVISDQCPWSLVQCCLDTLHHPLHRRRAAPVTTRQYHVCRAVMVLLSDAAESFAREEMIASLLSSPLSPGLQNTQLKCFLTSRPAKIVRAKLG